jgi:putative chitinase
VRWGETLSGIAARYGTTVQAIANANGIHCPSRIYAGQRLVIPGGRACYQPAPCKPPCGGWHGGWHGGCCRYHYVRWGENLSSIAWRYGTSVNALVAANGIVNPNCIYAGQRLCIPCGHGHPHPQPHPQPHPCGGFWYTVRWGDTVSGLAWRYGVSIWSIVNANGLANPNCIYAGQRLYIPGRCP